MGYCVLVAYGLDRLTINFRWKPRSALVVAMAMAAILAGRTVVRNQVWHSRETLFKSGIEVLPNNAKVHYNYANYLKDVGKTTEAIKHYEKAILLYPKHASAHNNLGTLLNNSLEAEDHFWRAIAINPQHAGAHFNLGNVMHAKNKLLQAEKFLLEAINLEPNSVDSYTNLAAVYADLKEFTYADTYYRKALQVAPHDPNCFNNYGVYLNKIGKPEQALKYYERAYTIDPSHQVSIVNAARLLRSLERNIEAENLFRSALWIERNPGTLDLAGIFYFNTAEPDTALELFQEALFKDPHNADVKVHYAQVLTSLKQYDKAEELILQVLETQIDHVEALKHLANMYGILQKHSLAIQYLDQALQYTTDTTTKAQLYYNKGNHLRDLEDFDGAYKSYGQCLLFNPWHMEVQLNIGVILHMKKQYKMARFHYNEALRLNPTHKLLQQNIEKLNRVYPMDKEDS